MSGLAGSALFILDHARRRALRPLNEARWRSAAKPFWSKGVKGLKFELHPAEHVDRFIFTEGLYEKRFLFLIERLFAGSNTALDVGANIGNHTLFLARFFKKVHAFEPNPATLARLNRHVAANRASNVAVHAFGLSDRPAFLPFADASGENAGVSRFVPTASDQTLMLEVKRGDDFLREKRVENIDFVKIDVEGHEVAVLEGLRETIAKEQPGVAFEFHPSHFGPGYFEKFRDALPGYSFFDCDIRGQDGGAENLAAFLGQGGLPRVVPLLDPTRATYENILALPPSRVSLLSGAGVRIA